MFLRGLQVTGGERRKTRNDFCKFTCKAAHGAGWVKLDVPNPVNIILHLNRNIHLKSKSLKQLQVLFLRGELV